MADENLTGEQRFALLHPELQARVLRMRWKKLFVHHPLVVGPVLPSLQNEQLRRKREVTGLAASPDGRTILYTQLDALTTDIVLVDNFQ